MVKNYTRPGFQFVPGNGRSTFLLSRAQSEPIVRDEYFKTNTRNFYPMFAQFSPRSQCFYVPFDLGRGARRFIDSFHAPPFRATTYIVFLRPNRRAYPPIASSYLSWCPLAQLLLRYVYFIRESNCFTDTIIIAIVQHSHSINDPSFDHHVSTRINRCR